MNNLVDYYYKQPLLEKNSSFIWYLIDIREEYSLLKESTPHIYAHLFNPQTKKMKKVLFSQLDSNFSCIESGLVEEVLKLNQLFLNS